MLTIVTVVHDNLAGLRRLADELAPALGPDLHWVVQDSGASKETQRWAEQLEQLKPSYLDFASVADRGIYDALNLAAPRVQSTFYLVVGSDDSIDPAALRDVASTLHDSDAAQIDVLSYPVRTSRGIRRRKTGWPRWLSASGLVSSHSVGTVIRTALHDTLGPYDTRYRILADSLFLRRAYDAGARFADRPGPVLGSFALSGVSSTEHARRIVETYSYQRECGSPAWLQSMLLMLRLWRYRVSSLI